MLCGLKLNGVVMYTLREETKRAIEKATGLPYDEIVRMSPEEKAEYVKKRHPNITFSREVDYRKMPRGNVLLAQGRIKTIEEVNKEIDKALKITKGNG